MASTAFKTVYREEFVASFEERMSFLRSTTTLNSGTNGNTAIFLVAGSGGATAVTRGANGLIPARNDDQTQNTCTLTEWHDLPQKTGFTVDLGQSDQRRMMQMTSMGVINRKIDDQILTELNTATNDTGSATTASLALVMKAKVILGVNEVPVQEEDNMFGVISPAMDGYLMQVPAYTSADYVEVKPFAGPARRFRRWAGINWIIHPNVPGVGTNAEKCFIYHRAAIGHAVAMSGTDSVVGYNEEQAYHYVRTSTYMGSKLLQNSGVCVINHDGSAFAAS
jgi:hypothetical protein